MWVSFGVDECNVEIWSGIRVFDNMDSKLPLQNIRLAKLWDRDRFEVDAPFFFYGGYESGLRHFKYEITNLMMMKFKFVDSSK